MEEMLQRYPQIVGFHFVSSFTGQVKQFPDTYTVTWYSDIDPCLKNNSKIFLKGRYQIMEVISSANGAKMSTS